MKIQNLSHMVCKIQASLLTPRQIYIVHLFCHLLMHRRFGCSQDLVPSTSLVCTVSSNLYLCLQGSFVINKHLPDCIVSSKKMQLYLICVCVCVPSGQEERLQPIVRRLSHKSNQIKKGPTNLHSSSCRRVNTLSTIFG